MSHPRDNPLHLTAAKLSLQIWCLLYEGDYHTKNGPDEDALYDEIHDSLAKALANPSIRQELARALKAKDLERRC